MSDSVIISKPTISLSLSAPVIGAAADLNVSNSDDSYSVDIGNDLELPDITFTDSDGSTSSVPAVTDIVATLCTTSQQSYTYPMLSQTTSYRTGDEGWQYQNIWNAIYGQNTTDRRAVIGLSDFYTLESNNQFGNTARFTNSSGVEISNGANENTTIYDNYLGIQFRAQNTFIGGQSWENAIDDAVGYDDGSWLPMPVCIVEQITDFQNATSQRLNNKIAAINDMWTATTNRQNTNRAYEGDMVASWLVAQTTKSFGRQMYYIYKLI